MGAEPHKRSVIEFKPKDMLPHDIDYPGNTVVIDVSRKIKGLTVKAHTAIFTGTEIEDVTIEAQSIVITVDKVGPEVKLRCPSMPQMILQDRHEVARCWEKFSPKVAAPLEMPKKKTRSASDSGYHMVNNSASCVGMRATPSLSY